MLLMIFSSNITFILQDILEGYKQGNGIVCSHCDTEVDLFVHVAL